MLRILQLWRAASALSEGTRLLPAYILLDADKTILGKGGEFDVHVHGKPEFVAEDQAMVPFLPGKYIKTVFLRIRKQQVSQTVAHTLYRCSRALCCVEIWLSPAKSSMQKVPSLCTTHNALCAQLFCSTNDVQHLAISTLIQFLTIFLCGV